MTATNQPDSVDAQREKADAVRSALDKRVGSTLDPQVRLVRTPAVSRGEVPQFSGLVEALVAGAREVDYERPYAVLGGPGTGKSTVLVEAAVRHIVTGGSADSIMFFAPSKDAAAAMRAQIFARLAGDDDYASTGSVVRSVHSWAFAFYRAIRAAAGESSPRLMTGAEHDMAIRELLLGTAQDGNRYWPENVVPALSYVGFARQLRDFILRATERNVSAKDLVDYGERFHRPMWQAAGHFLEEFNQVQRLGVADNLNASELLHATLAALDSPEGQRIVEDQRAKVKLILVDDAHNLDPASAAFIESFMVPGVRTLIAGDPDQCVFHFRGASEDFLDRHAAHDDYRVVLSASHRLAPETAEAVNAVRAELPASSTRVPLRGSEHEQSPSIEMTEAATLTARHLQIADAIRRAHLHDGVAWEDIAVIVRSTGDIPALRRVLMNHDVPVTIDPTAVVLAEQPLVKTLLLAVEASYRSLTAAEVQDLLESPVGGADPVMVRRVQRAVARAIRRARAEGRTLPQRDDGRPPQAADLLADYLVDPSGYEWVAEFFGPREITVVERLQAVLTAGREAVRERLSSEMVLWKIWQATQLSTRLQAHALRGGTLGAQADQDLDAVMNLFDLAGDFAERNPQAGVSSLVREVRSQELPTGGRDRRGEVPHAVEILPAHAAAGRQWRFVVVTGLQEDSWPAGPTVGGLFGQLELVDLVDRGIEPGTPISRMADAVHEERRLFLLAISRATDKTLLAYVSSSGEEALVPSRFLKDVAPVVASINGDSAEPDDAERSDHRDHLPRVLAVEPLIAELRDAVMDTARPGHERQAAARNLAKLAAAGVYGAAPDQWWGSADPSCERPIIRENQIWLSPSRLESLEECPLRTFLENQGGVAEDTEPMRIGILVHAIAEAIVDGLSVDDAHSLMATALAAISEEPEWKLTQMQDEWREGIDKLHGFITSLQHGSTTLETEQELRGCVGETADGITVMLGGRIDLMTTSGGDGERAETADTYVYDFKTGATAVSGETAENSPQLEAYQFLVTMDPHRGHAAGAALVYPRYKSKSITIRQQGARSEDTTEQFRQRVLQLAPHAAGPVFPALPGDHCQHCSVRLLCPAQPEGKQVV